MNNKKLIAGVFSLGIIVGAVASEQLSNGLYKFKSGDAIIADEVNANFELLQGRIEELQKSAGLTKMLGHWDCTGEMGLIGELYFDSDGSFSTSTIVLASAAVGQWTPVGEYRYEFDVAGDISILDIRNTSYSDVYIEAQDPTYDNYTCQKKRN